MRKSPLRVGLIGLGRMGQNHLRNLSFLKEAEVAFVHDMNPVASKHATSHGVAFQTSLTGAFRDIDAAIICTPTSTHAEYVRKAVEAGVRNVFVEKPLSDTLESAQSTAELCRQNAVRLQVGFIERFNPAVQELKKILDGARQVVNIDFMRTNKVSSRITDVDVVADLMIHDIDLALYLNGAVASVSAYGLKEGPMINFASALLIHKNGRFSRVQASRISEKKIRSIQATCMDMFVDCDLLRKEIVINRQAELQQVDGEPYKISAIEESIEVRPQEALLTELRAFIAYARGESVDIPDVHAGLEAMRICSAIQASVHR